jgi:hypothetical protein
MPLGGGVGSGRSGSRAGGGSKDRPAAGPRSARTMDRRFRGDPSFGEKRRPAGTALKAEIETGATALATAIGDCVVSRAAG